MMADIYTGICRISPGHRGLRLHTVVVEGKVWAGAIINPGVTELGFIGRKVWPGAIIDPGVKEFGFTGRERSH